MDLPETIRDLCELLEASAESIEIPCYFCKKPLDPQDKHRFSVRDLRLTYKDGKPYGSCSRCTRQAARHERETALHTVPVTLHEIELLEGVGIDRIVLRCTNCLKPLAFTEKLAYAQGGFYAIALGNQKYRAVCRYCMRPDGQA
ncbi:E6 [Rousettus aegyptiacus papillomavirus 1]|uniref:Protein E6 n=1 Tax=Rousettus aegyptiacus papillomavirus 1 TaxID=369584 RepID=Q0QII1_9PAPI|nr:E6 [Rousettus aegyptiacus papillomavirus 1]ABC95024.1 E6 [Rousettus aegyptiacus papillomavirus 1]